ncbi:hypothetical protein [Lacticaseibacillus suihuaensis]
MEMGSIADWLNVAATTGAAIGAFIFAAQANKSAERQTNIAADQGEITKSLAEAENKPLLKFIVTANLGDNGKKDGYRIVAVNHGKAPAVLSLPFTSKASAGLSKRLSTLHILDLPRGSQAPADGVVINYRTDFEADGSDQAPEPKGKYPIGSFQTEFCNSVVVMPQAQVLVYVAGKGLGHVIQDLSKPLAFHFYEAIENRHYLERFTFKTDEGITLQDQGFIRD